MNITSIADLQSLVPPHIGGAAINYGQGEGQLRIGDTVWGFYTGNDNRYYFTLEEGLIELGRATEIAEALLEQVRARWGSEIRGELKGIWHDDPEMRLT